MPIWVLEIARITSPKGIFGGLHYLCTCFSRLVHKSVNFFFTTHIMSDRKLGRTMSSFGHVRVMSNAISKPNCELQTTLQIKKSDSAVFKPYTNDSLRWKAESISIKFQRFFQIVYAQCN